MSYDSKQHGRAGYNSWMHIASGEISGMVQGLNSESLVDRQYAQMVYQINPSPIEISGGISVGDVGINFSSDGLLKG